MTDLLIRRHGRVLVSLGAPNAVAPLRGTLTGASGAAIGSFVTSVWADDGVIAETDGVTQGSLALRVGLSTGAERSIAGSFALPPGKLPARGRLTEQGVDYQYTSFPAKAYPSGDSLREYLLRPVRSTAARCGATDQDTVVNTLSHVARLIYEGEIGGRALTQVHRVQNDPALLSAVARRDAAGTRSAVEACSTSTSSASASAPAGACSPTSVARSCSVPWAPRCDSAGARSAASCSRSRTTRATCDSPGRLVGLNVLMRMGSQAGEEQPRPGPGRSPRQRLLPLPRAHLPRVHVRRNRVPGGPAADSGAGPDPLYLSAHAGASDTCLACSACRSWSKESENFSTPSRSSVSVTSS